MNVQKGSFTSKKTGDRGIKSITIDTVNPDKCIVLVDVNDTSSGGSASGALNPSVCFNSLTATTLKVIYSFVPNGATPTNTCTFTWQVIEFD